MYRPTRQAYSLFKSNCPVFVPTVNQALICLLVGVSPASVASVVIVVVVIIGILLQRVSSLILVRLSL